MKRKITLLLAALLALTSVLAACGGSPAKTSGTPAPSGSTAPTGETVKIIFANYGSSSMPPAKADRDSIAYIEEKSNGTIKYDYVPDGVLGGEADMMQQVMDGTIQCIECGATMLNTYTSLSECFQLPFLITDYETAEKAMSSDAARAIYDKIGEELGLKIICYQENGLRHFANNIRPITSVADMKGLKLRVAPSAMLNEAITLLGASPMTIGYNDVYSALQNKVVDGEEINITSVYAMKHYEQLEYISEIGMYPFPVFVVYNLDFWNSLTTEQQEIIIAGHEYGNEGCSESTFPTMRRRPGRPAWSPARSST